MYLEIKHLNLVKNIAKTGNLTQAAHMLRLSQSAISRQLLDIEAKLGTDLFFRTKKKMILTSAGQELLKTAEGVISDLEHTEKQIMGDVHGNERLRIGMSCMLCYTLLPEVIRQYHALYPRIDLDIGSSEHYLSDLRSGRYDLVITSICKKHDGLRYDPIFSEEILMISAPDHPLARKGIFTRQDIGNDKVISIFHEDREELGMVLQMFKIENWPSIMVVEHFETIIELVKADIGISFMPRWIVQDLLDKGLIGGAGMSPDPIHLDWQVLSCQRKNTPKHFDDFIRLLKQFCPGGQESVDLRFCAGTP
ncbi:MAG: LysR family transcriptional regulator [Thermodesulfobacteriota bacterium]|nr:LysR family transcriptional regulator [Thermodesulfobacteriota bacterium]